MRRAAAAYRLAIPSVPLRGRNGERPGAGVGSSLEFLDHRDYVPGDDLRHVDWRAFARTDQLQVRLYHEEVSPTFEVVVDRSASMGVSAAKLAALGDLADALSFLAVAAGGRAQRLAAQGDVLQDGAPLRAEGRGESLRPHAPLRAHSLRVVLSDFLFPRDPRSDLRALAHGAALLYVIQLLDPEELDPPSTGATTLVDAETEERLDVTLDAGAVARYRRRLEALCEDVSRATRALGGRYARVRAAALETMLREDLLRAGVVLPR